MSTQHCQLLFTDAGAPGLAHRRDFNATDLVEVEDRLSHARLRLKVEDVSVYRHTLLLEGKPCRILNILK